MSTSDEKFLLSLKIIGTDLPRLEIKQSSEEAFRAAEKKINSKINEHRATFEIDINEAIAMTAVETEVENFSLRKKNNTKVFEDTINSLIIELDEFLKK